MKKSINPVKKAVIFALLFGFTIIILISFGMPSGVLNRTGGNDAASINGTKISALQVRRFFKMNLPEGQDSPEMMDRILSYMIDMELDYQFAVKKKIDVSKSMVQNVIKRTRSFTDENGNYIPENFNSFLKHYGFTLTEYHLSMKKSVIAYELSRMIDYSAQVTDDEMQYANIARNSEYQIRFIFLPDRDIREKFKTETAVTEDEITKELKDNPAEVRDPETDRTRIKSKLEMKKTQVVKTALESKLNAVSEKGGKIEEAASVLGGKIFNSAPYKIGAKITEESNPENVLTGLMMSDTYFEGIINLEPGQISKAINSVDGIYVFTPLKKQISQPDLRSALSIKNDLYGQKKDYMYEKLTTAFKEKSSINKNAGIFRPAEQQTKK